jgi:uncharacterized protein (DUF983 family)
LATRKICPQCGSGDLQAAGGRALRCGACGTKLVYGEPPWYVVVLAWALLSLSLGLGSIFLLKNVFHWYSSWIWLIVFPVIAVLAQLISRRFRPLRRA